MKQEQIQDRQREGSHYDEKNKDVRTRQSNQAYETQNVRRSTKYYRSHPNYQRVSGYTNKFCTPQIRARLKKSIIHLRRYKLSMNIIAKELGCSTQTVYRHLSAWRSNTIFDEVGRGFNANRRRKFQPHLVKIATKHQGKITLKTLISRLKTWIFDVLGHFFTFEVATEGEPP